MLVAAQCVMYNVHTALLLCIVTEKASLGSLDHLLIILTYK